MTITEALDAWRRDAEAQDPAETLDIDGLVDVVARLAAWVDRLEEYGRRCAEES